MIFYSSIKEGLKTRLLIRGTLLSLLGMVPLLYGGLFLSVAELAYWGFPLFVIGGGLIAWALIPYKRLTQVEAKPFRLLVDEEGDLFYLVNGKYMLKIPHRAISTLSYVDLPMTYGIAIKIDMLPNALVIVYDEHFFITHFRRKSLAISGFDLFFPYFSLKSFQALEKTLKTVELE